MIPNRNILQGSIIHLYLIECNDEEPNKENDNNLLNDNNLKVKHNEKTTQEQDKNEKNLSTSEGTKIDSLTTSYGLSQIISDPTHILPNSSFSIDLIFTNQPNLVTVSGVIHPYTLNVTIKLYSRNSISK